MEFPPAEEISTHESTFESAHSEAKQTQFDGSVYIDAGDAEGVAVYMEGWPIYAMYRGTDAEAVGKEALDAMVPLSGTLERHTASRERVEMFRNYMEFVGRTDGLMDIYEPDNVEVRGRTILVTKAGDLEKVNVPGGVRRGYAPNEDYLASYFEKTGIDGYGLSNNEIVFYEDGEVAERERFKDDGLSILVRIDSKDGLGALECEYLDVYTQSESGGKADVEFDIEGWEIVESGEDDSDGGIVGKIFG